MKLGRREFLQLVAGGATLPVASGIDGARAQSYPSRPVRIIVGAPPGGGHDIAARLIAPRLEDRLGQSFFIDNRPGANTNIGAQAAAKAAPDGYTLLLLGATHAMNMEFYGKLAVDITRDIVPVAALSRAGFVMVVHPSVPAKTVPEFISYAKANPGKLNMASGAISEQLCGELFKMMASVSMLDVPYPRHGARVDRSARRTNAGVFRGDFADSGTYPRGQASCAGGDDRDAVRSSTSGSDRGRIFARIRGQRMGGYRRPPKHARRYHQQA
jgi:tripartite-type tricarboxylate transporter receptor subunit TctC